MFGQTFRSSDIGTVAFLVLLEALLSADNALILAIMVRHLPPELQRKALLYGMGGAFGLRIAAILLAAFIINFWWLQAIGAAYLLFLPIKHFVDHSRRRPVSKGAGRGFWATVVYLNLLDTAFALDSVIVAVAVVDTVRHPDKLWVVMAGAVLGIMILRFAASYFIRLLERYPVLDHVAYILVGWAGLKLIFIAGHSFELWFRAHYFASPLPFELPELPAWLFWIGMAVIGVVGGLLAVRSGGGGVVVDEAQAAELEEKFTHQIPSE